MSSLLTAVCLGDALRETIEKFPDRPALWVNSHIFTYRELSRLAMEIARHFEGDSSQKVAIFSDRNEIAYAAIMAAALTGRTYVPLNPRFPVSRTIEMLKQSAAVNVVCDERCSKLLVATSEPLFDQLNLIAHKACTPSQVHEYPASNNLGHSTASHEIAYIIFTSGTTGKPKGVPVTHQNLLTYLRNISGILKPHHEDRFTQSSDFTFDFSVHDIFTAWCAGAVIYSIPEAMAPMTDRFVRSFEITVCSLVPSSAAIIKASGRLLPGSLPSLRLLILGGEALAPSIASSWKDAAVHSSLINMYGPTETTVAVTTFEWRNEYESQIKGSVPLGFPLTDQNMQIVDESLKPVSAGITGELVVSGSQVTSGYLNNPTATTKRYVKINGSENTWYRTGDQATYNDRFGFLYRGRIDQQIKVRGFRVETQEIEGHLRTASGSDSVAVIGFPKDPNGIIMGVVGFAARPKFPEEVIIAACKKLMPDHMVPSRVFAVTELPLNPNGKTDYAALRDRATSQA